MVDNPLPDLDRRTLLVGALALLALGGVPAMTGCARTGDEGPPVPGTRRLSAAVPRVAVGLRDATGLAEVVDGMRSFGRDLHRVCASTAANWTASPLSIAVAAGMLRAGCRGATGAQVDRVLGFPVGSVPEGTPHEALNALTSALVTTGPVSTAPAPTPSGQPGPPPIVAVANGLFLDTGFADRVQSGFLRLLAAQYGADATAVSFADPSAVATINAWVAAQTRDRIRKLFDALDASTVLVLANAVYLKAAWTNQFSTSETTDGPFTTAAGRSVTAPLMRQTVQGVAYRETAAWQRVSLPYVGNELAMRIVLPRAVVRDRAGLTDLLPVATEPVPPDRSGWVELTLPRWDTGTDIALADALRRLGMTDAFEPGRADLTGIAPGLVVTDAVHRANVTVDELGTEAAAVTGFAVGTSALPGGPVPMRVDRPFVWAVVHEPTGTPVFTGHVVDATA